MFNNRLLYMILVLLFLLLVFAICYNKKLDEVLFRPEKIDKFFHHDHSHIQMIKLSPECNCEKYISKKHGTKCKQFITCYYFNKYKNQKTLLYFHGRSGNVLKYSSVFKMCDEMKMNIFFVDYRGYGRSSGYACLKNFYKDVDKSYEYLSSKIPSKNIIIWGESLGGIAGIHIASKWKCDRLVLYGTFSSISDTFERNVDILGKLVNNLENKKRMEKVKCPVFIIHCLNDTIVPFSCSKILFNQIKHDNKYLCEIEGDHDSPVICKEKFLQIVRFLKNEDDLCVSQGCYDYLNEFLSSMKE